VRDAAVGEVLGRHAIELLQSRTKLLPRFVEIEARTATRALSGRLPFGSADTP
jgi:hypothetical protein